MIKIESIDESIDDIHMMLYDEMLLCDLSGSLFSVIGEI